ncbi:monovalent cation/H+ antiporter subunit D [Palleronia abyssalis]|uniref:Na(+)/H(+) antiporter subunit D n=1 Tax=Palleronia abyssalis TaxID=1501240 RepID=A0A2R8BT04_9RHOB|nr:monovalent cation/H+ antiporter subunit D [Palleronia abyssalis]SPJ23273.1 Na(+)/H(+) antiporter subunit D [Palleronia abyssalis]
MSHWVIAPIILPAMLAAIIVLVARYHKVVQRTLSVSGLVALLGIATSLAWRAADGTVTIYQLGAWQAPFGIVLVADRLSTYMVLLTAILALLVSLYAIGSGWDRRGRHFHALFQFQIMGITGAFLTGDIFNLFVFFEVLLIASYGLVIHSGGAVRLRAGTQYVLYNLLGSTLFLFALGTLYAETGTLNMADLAQRVAMIDPAQSAAIRVAAVLLLLVFAVKAALVPLHFWLPSAYAEAPGPVAALFAIMTKVGAYAIIRVYTLIFPPSLSLTEGLHGTWLLPLALVSLALGMIGVLAAKRLDRLVAFSVVGSMGMVMTAIAMMTEDGMTAALYYIAHSTFATAALFLLVDLIQRGRRSHGTRLEAAPPMVGGPLIAGMFFVAAIGMTGLPPLSGFLGKLLILDAGFASPLIAWIWAAVLGSSLIAVLGFARAGSTVFWKSGEVARGLPEASEPADESPPPVLALAAVGSFVGLLALHTVFAGPITSYLGATSEQLFAPEPYISTVLETPGKEISYDGGEGDH